MSDFSSAVLLYHWPYLVGIPPILISNRTTLLSTFIVNKDASWCKLSRFIMPVFVFTCSTEVHLVVLLQVAPVDFPVISESYFGYFLYIHNILSILRKSAEISFLLVCGNSLCLSDISIAKSDIQIFIKNLTFRKYALYLHLEQYFARTNVFTAKRLLTQKLIQ